MRQRFAPLALAASTALGLFPIASPDALADEPPDDETTALEPPPPLPELQLPEERPERPEGLSVSLEGSLSRRYERVEAAGMLLLTLPLDRIARPRLARRDVRPRRLAGPTLEPPSDAAARSEPERPTPEPEPEPEKPIPVVVRPDVARSAVRAALAHARLTDADARIDALASRARTSAVLPELRLRATRLVDESQSLSPTESDPTRTTMKGGASFWLEARATWRLDRLVFADEEVAIERIRDDRAAARAALTERVLELLFTWQHARAIEADEARTPDERLAATLRALEAEAALDVATDGWFSRWRERAHPEATR